VRKPDPAAYARVLRDLAVSPQRCLFVDDRESNCEAARQSGMRAIRFENVEALRASLSELGIV
jgi:HAD superfamily hydrolase (TIGR01509 family)